MAEQQLGFKVGVGAEDRTCPACGQNDPDVTDPRHIIRGVTTRAQSATLADGTVVAVNVPVDDSYHFDCHAAMGCDHCDDMVKHNDGSVKGKVGKVAAPKHLHKHDIGEHFEQAHGTGILRRTDAGHKHLRAVNKNG